MGLTGKYRTGAGFHQVTKTGYKSNFVIPEKLLRQFENQSLGTGDCGRENKLTKPLLYH